MRSANVMTFLLGVLVVVTLLATGSWIGQNMQHDTKSAIPSAAKTEATEATAEYTITKTVPEMGEYTITELVPGEIVAVSVTKMRGPLDDPRPLLHRGIQEVNKRYILKDWLPEGFNDPGNRIGNLLLSSVILRVEPREKRD